MKRTETLRLIDAFGAKELLFTPFQSIKDSFLSLEEDHAGRLLEVSFTTPEKQRAFSMTIQGSILGFSESKKPEGMTVSLNNRELSFRTDRDSSDVTWKWIDTQRNLNIRDDKNFNPTFDCIILEKNKAFDFDVYFPDAPVTIEIAARRNWHRLDLDIDIDGRFVESRTLKRRYQTYSIPLHIPSGVHTVSLKPRISTRNEDQAGPTPPRLLINEVQILSRNDLILFFSPQEREAELLKGTIHIKYLSDRLETGKAHPDLDLYRIKHNPSFDLIDQEENPDKIKKKILLEDLSLDVLMAPAESTYVFDVTIPPGSALKFGLGILQTKNSKQQQSVKFAIDIEKDGQRNRLYEKVYVSDSRPMREQLVFEHIDLEDWAGRHIKLIFSTTGDSQETNVLSFWHNPVIIHPSLKNPKIILVSLDTLRADHLGSYGYNRETSPHLDALAKDGVMFTHTYAQSSWTLPSHVSLLYSLNSVSHQVYYPDQRIDTSLPSIADILKRDGYLTTAITSGGYVSRIFGFDDGFDLYDEPLDKSKDPLGQFEAERLFAYTSEWLKKNKDNQFFLFLHTYQTHGPYCCPSPWNEHFLQRGAEWNKMDLTQLWVSRGKDYAFTPEEIANIVSLYDGEILYTDEMLIKPLVDLLKALDIYDETLIFITSDHGEEFYEHKGWLHGRALYEESIKVPLIVKFPRSQFKNTRIETKCRSIDIMPTILDISSVEYDRGLFEGQSLMPMILGKERTDRSFISDLAHQDIPDPCPALVAGNTGDLKIIITRSEKEGTKDIEVYDLKNDPGERSNQILAHRNIIRDFVKMIDAYYRDKMKILRNTDLIKMDEKQKEKLRALGYIQ